MGESICSRCRPDLSAPDDVLLTKLREVCFNFLLSTRNEKLAECLEALDRPAGILTADLTMLFSNDLLDGNPAIDAEKPRIGEVLDCMNSALLGRCGDTAACFLCGIRKAVEYTATTGEALQQYPTNVQKRSGVGQKLLLTTEKTGDAVLVVLEVPSGRTSRPGA